MINESAFAQLFVSKYRSLYDSVSFDKDDLQYILNELDGKVCDDKLYYSNCFFTDLDVRFRQCQYVLHGVKLLCRRILQYNSHSYFLPSLSDTLPVYDDI